jgi:uncharacterized protein (TIGR02246 family)
MRGMIVAATLLAVSTPLAAAESCATLDAKGVAALFDDWNFALSSLDASQVVQRYWPNAVLLPTVSNTPRTNAAMIGDYFEHFLAKRPRGRIDTRTIQGGCNVAMDMGTYTFSLMDDKGTTSEVAARYTFIYQYRDGAWKILHHHSSAMPEAGAATVANAAPEMHPAPAEKTAAPVKPVPAARVAPPPPKPAQETGPPKVVAKPTPKPAEPPVAQARPAAEAKPATEARPAVEAKTTMFANLASSPPPSKFYPPEAAKRKERGNVNLRICADGEGAISGTPEILKSSGSKLLDEAALSWARAAKWVPATLNNRRVEGCTQVDVAFEAAA